MRRIKGQTNWKNPRKLKKRRWPSRTKNSLLLRKFKSRRYQNTNQSKNRKKKRNQSITLKRKNQRHKPRKKLRKRKITNRLAKIQMLNKRLKKSYKKKSNLIVNSMPLSILMLLKSQWEVIFFSFKSESQQFKLSFQVIIC